MMIGATGHTSASERIPPALACQLVDLMAQQRMLPETMHMLQLCQSDDALIVVGSDIQLRLQILSIDEGLDNALNAEMHDPENPAKHFERLLERFDDLRKSLPDTDESIVTETWPSMRAAIVRQTALSYVRDRQRGYPGPASVNWGAISLEAYLEYVDRLIPPVDEDMDALVNEERMSEAKERRNLTDIFLEKRRIVNGVKVRILLKENRLETFKEAMRAFTRELDSALLPTPKLLQRYSVISLLDEDVGTGVDERHGLTDELLGSSSKPNPSVESPAGPSPKRKRADNVPVGKEVPESAQALAKANEHLQREMTGHPGTVAEALAIGETVPQPRNPPQEKGTDVTASGAGERWERTSRSTEPARKRPLVTRTSPGEQVDFDDSQSVDEPSPQVQRRATLVDRPLPRLASPLESTAAARKGRRPRLAIPNSTARPRVPWTEEEVKHLNAAVSALGRGKWKQALALYKFQDCRTAVDLKDKWRNLHK